jgi:hypothetical protein
VSSGDGSWPGKRPAACRFCSSVGGEHLPAATAYAWRHRLRQEAGRGRAATLPAVGFAPLRVIPEALGWLPGGLIEILLPADRRVRLAGKVDKAMLAAVVAVLTAAGLDGQEG